MKKYWKRCLAVVMALAMVMTLIPESALGYVLAENGDTEAPLPVLHYDMSHTNGKLTDISGNNKDGTLCGFQDSDFSTSETDEETLNFGDQKYVEIPSGVIPGETFAIEATYTASTKSAAWLFTLGNTVDSWPNVKNYLFVSPYANDQTYGDHMLAAVKDGETEKRYPETKLLQGYNDSRENTVTVIFDKGNITYYLNGNKSEVTESGFKIQELLAAHSNQNCCGYIGKSLYKDDPYFNGTLKDFKIYDQPLTENLLEDAKKNLPVIMLNGNSSAGDVSSDLSFPEAWNGISLTWSPEKLEGQDVIGSDGKVLWNGAETAVVNIAVTGVCNEKKVLEETYSVTVTGKSQAEFDALTIRNADSIKGNITLPTVGENGSKITWESSNEAVISTKEVKNSGYDSTPAGVVHRQAEDTKVTLTATLQQGGSEKKKEIEVTVKAKPEEKEKTDYLFAYFIGDGKEADGQKQEQIFFAASRDGLNWGELNNAAPVLSSSMGEEGLRDPYIIRSAEGDKFYMIATDLQIAAGNGWDAAQKAGSQAIMVWESEDLINWGDQRMVTVSKEIDAGCTWAPEAFYDEQTGEYVVFWASKVKGKNYDKQRVYYCKTRDFYTFTKPKLWIEKSFSVIDTTVVRDDDGTYYRFTKNENNDEKYIFMEKSNSLLKGWTSVPSATLQAEKWREGPCSFKFSSEDIAAAGGKWAVLLDDFGGVGYYPMVTDDFMSAEFTKLTTANLPKVKKPRHGTVLNVTAEEYERLVEHYGATPFLTSDSVPDLVGVGYELPSKAELNYAGEIMQAEIAWSKAKLESVGKETVTGTISGTGKTNLDGKTVSKEIEVVSASENAIYFIDSGVGEWNENQKKSSTYQAVGRLAELRNTVPDQRYEEGVKGSWGYVDDQDVNGTNLGIHSNASTSIYENGWYAKSGKNCEYIFPLENGSYTATGYFKEWWNTNRPMKFFVKYTKDDGTEVTSSEQNVSIKGTDEKTASVSFTVEDISGTTPVHVLTEKTGTADPVIAGLSIEKVLTDDEKAKAEAASAALEEVTLSSDAELTLQPGETADISLTYPSGYEAAVEAANYKSSVTYVSNNTRAAEVDADGKITAKAAGTARITAKVAISSKLSKSFTVDVAVSGKPVEQVTLNKTSLNIKTIGSTAKLKATVTPADAADRVITWTSSNESIASVSGGIVTAQKEGTATITASAANGQKAECSVTVGEIIQTDPKPVESVTLNKTELTLEIGGSETLEATVLPAEAEQAVSWTSNKEETASVDENGKVTALQEGEAVITVTAGDKTAVCTVTVSPKKGEEEEPKGDAAITLNKKELSLKVGESEVLTAAVTGQDLVTPDEAQRKISWESSAPEIAAVDETGKVTALKEGNAIITAQMGEAKDSCNVTVSPKAAGDSGTETKPETKPGTSTEPEVTPKPDIPAAPSKVQVEKVKLNKTKLTLGVKEKFTLKASVMPKNASDKKITWKVSKKGIISLTSKGVVTAKKRGTVKVTAAAGGRKASCTITVKKAPSKIRLNKTKITLKKGKTFKIKVKLPRNTASNKITYASSHKSVASVSAKGVIKARKKGRAVITAKTFNKKTAKITVTVK